jgi:hypothetical protein
MSIEVEKKSDKNFKTQIMKAFNEQFVEFIDDILRIFPNDPDIVLAKNSIVFFRKSNPKILIDVWYRYVTLKYKDIILDGDLSFFIDKKYDDDLINLSEWATQIMDVINRLKGPLKNMDETNQKKSMKYCQNLLNLSLIYWEE